MRRDALTRREFLVATTAVAAMEARTDGYLLKENDGRRIVSAIHAVLPDHTSNPDLFRSNARGVKCD